VRIVIGAYYRTGSTWLYNAVRLSCIEAGLSVSIQGNADPVEYDTDIIIHKVHEFSGILYQKADRVFTIERDLIAADASFERAFGHPMEEKARERALWGSDKWKAQADRVFQFTDIKDDPLLIIASVGASIGEYRIHSDFLIRIHELMLALQPPKDKVQDPESLYFTNHITSNGSHGSDSST